MICSKQFLDFYNSTFEYIGEKYGYHALCDYWKHISKTTLADLKECVEKDGLSGCFRYWTTTLPAEGAQYKITLNGKFILEILECPSIKHLGDRAYRHYCDHCAVMYQEVFKELGYDYTIEIGETCTIEVSK